MRRSIALCTLVLASASCAGERTLPLPPFGQILLYVDTDAPLPAAPGDVLGPGDAPPLFDRVRIDIHRPGEPEPCAECTHEFDLDRKLVAERRASVGITPPVGAAGHVARVRLYKASHAISGEPREGSSVDVTVALPPTEAEGITSLTVELSVDDLARPKGRDAPLVARRGEPRPGFTGSWAAARRVPCAGEARAGEVCVPGGAFWMGNPLSASMPGFDAEPRVIVLDPYFLDAREVTVGDLRDANLAREGDPIRHSGDPPFDGVQCTYQDRGSNFQALPVNCVSWELARAHCQARGADLPSEAQFAYAASGLEGRMFVWGDDAPTCQDAIYARANRVISPAFACPGAWVEPAGRGARDRLELPGGTIVDLAGNVAEHVLDYWSIAGDACRTNGVFRNPICEEPSLDPAAPGGARMVAGGHWVGPAFVTAATSRGPVAPFASATDNSNALTRNALVLTAVGFRCARSAKP